MKRKSTIFSFCTYRDNKPRTVGICCFLKEKSSTLEYWKGPQAISLNKLFGYNEDEILAAAKGKVAFITANDNEFNSTCYQVKQDSVQEVFCGNSTAAISATILKSNALLGNEILFNYSSEGAKVKIKSFSKNINGKLNITQKYELLNSEIKIEATEKNEIKINCLNDYTFLIGSSNNIENAIRDTINNGNLSKKLCVIDPGLSSVHLSFYNCNGLHGAAPQTGLASLSLIYEKLDWIKDMFYGKKILTPSSIEVLPKITREINTKSIFIQMPNVDVKLTKIY